MFWGLIMEPKRRYYQKVTRPFHISMASMDLSACTKEPVQLMVQFQKRNYLLCTLVENGPIQVSLDLNFEVGDEVSFTINGHSHVHLSGYHVDDEFEEHEDGDEVDIKEVVEKKEDVSLSNIIYGKRKQAKSSAMIVTQRESTGIAEMISNNWETLQFFPAAKRSKTLQLLEDAADDGSDDDDDEDVTFSDLDDSSEEGDTTLDDVDVDVDVDDDDDDEVDLDDSDEDDDPQLEEGEGEEDEESENEGEGEQEEDEQESEEEIKTLVATKKQLKIERNKEKQQQKQVQQIPVKQKQQNKKDKQQPQQQPQQQPEKVNGTPASEKKKKRKRNKNQTPNESLSEDVNTSGKDNKKSPKNEKKQQNPQNTPLKIFVDRGVSIEEIVVGAGNPVKNGKFAHVYYEGRLKNNKKAFDSCLKGRPPFKFRLGSNEVIKGWDIGVAGMKIGGKRRITVPGNLAYGSQGQKPVIPPNATLVFDIELANVN